MHPFNNNKGIALITALMLTLITLVIILSVFFVMTNNIKSSAATKAYKNSTDASYGAVDLLAQDVIPRLFTNHSSSSAAILSLGITANNLVSDYSSLFMQFNSNACLQQKLNNTSDTGWSACPVDKTNPNPKKNPDLTFRLAGVSGQSFTVYSKIIDTIPGVTYPPAPAGGQLLGGGVTESSAPTTTNLNHYVYRIEISGERTLNPAEKSELSVLYEY